MKGYIVVLPCRRSELNDVASAYEFEGNFADLFEFFVTDAVNLSNYWEVAVILVTNLVDVMKILEKVRERDRQLYTSAGEFLDLESLSSFLRSVISDEYLAIVSLYDEADYIYTIDFVGSKKYECISHYRFILETFEKISSSTPIGVSSDFISSSTGIEEDIDFLDIDISAKISYEELLKILDAEDIEEVCRRLYKICLQA